MTAMDCTPATERSEPIAVFQQQPLRFLHLLCNGRIGRRRNGLDRLRIIEEANLKHGAQKTRCAMCPAATAGTCPVLDRRPQRPKIFLVGLLLIQARNWPR